jgi:hypothetical protein
MATIRGAVRRVLQAIGVKKPRVPELDPRLAGMEQVFRAPPMTRELADAIRLISPHCNFPPSEEYRAVWQADQNGACWGEYEALEPVFRAIPRPKKVLEIGPGMGRSLVFLRKKLGWQESELHAYEGNGSSTKYTILGPRFEDSFCGNIKMLEHVLEFNGVNNFKVFNAKDVKLSDLQGPYDLLYSFYCIGFHWSLEHFLDDLQPLLHERSVAIFTVAPDFKPFPRLETLQYRLVNYKTAYPKEDWLRMLVLGNVDLPKSP